jgi:hypothetical protein
VYLVCAKIVVTVCVCVCVCVCPKMVFLRDTSSFKLKKMGLSDSPYDSIEVMQILP